MGFRNFIDGPFFVLYADNLTNLNLRKMYQNHKKTGALGSIFLYKENMADEDTTPGIVVLKEDSFIDKIIEDPNKKEKTFLKNVPDKFKFTNSGIYILEKEVFEFIKAGVSDFAKQVFQEILKKGLKLYGYRENCYIREIGQMNRYLKAKEEIESGKVVL